MQKGETKMKINFKIQLPKSKTKERIIANLDVNVEISKEDLDYLNSLGHIGPTRPYRS
jgi:diketogulonate reductase-like aldo/keto reductase